MPKDLEELGEISGCHYQMYFLTNFQYFPPCSKVALFFTSVLWLPDDTKSGCFLLPSKLELYTDI